MDFPLIFYIKILTILASYLGPWSRINSIYFKSEHIFRIGLIMPTQRNIKLVYSYTYYKYNLVFDLKISIKILTILTSILVRRSQKNQIYIKYKHIFEIGIIMPTQRDIKLVYCCTNKIYQRLLLSSPIWKSSSFLFFFEDFFPFWRASMDLGQRYLKYILNISTYFQSA